jgi:hypothetical protein
MIETPKIGNKRKLFFFPVRSVGELYANKLTKKKAILPNVLKVIIFRQFTSGTKTVRIAEIMKFRCIGFEFG